MKKVEKNNRVFENVFLSTAACWICRSQNTDICDWCLKNSLAEFESKNIPFAFLRTFTMDEYKVLLNGIKGKLLAYYVIKVMEVLNGRDSNDPTGG